jgi:hypothetical protein
VLAIAPGSGSSTLETLTSPFNRDSSFQLESKQTKQKLRIWPTLWRLDVSRSKKIILSRLISVKSTILLEEKPSCFLGFYVDLKQSVKLYNGMAMAVKSDNKGILG